MPLGSCLSIAKFEYLLEAISASLIGVVPSFTPAGKLILKNDTSSGNPCFRKWITNLLAIFAASS